MCGHKTEHRECSGKRSICCGISGPVNDEGLSCQGVNGPSGSGSEAQADGSSSWRSLFPKQLELWRSAYSDKAATAPVGVPPAPMHSYADRVKKSAAPKLKSEVLVHA